MSDNDYRREYHSANENNMNADDMFYHDYGDVSDDSVDSMQQVYEMRYNEMKRQQQREQELMEQTLEVRKKDVRKTTFIAISLVLMFGGLFAIVHFALVLSAEHKMVKGAEMIYAEVVDYDLAYSSGEHDSYRPVLQFDYKGEEYVKKSVHEYVFISTLKRGDTIKAYVKQTQSGDVVVYAFNEGYYILMIVLSCIGAVIGTIMFFGYHYYSKKYNIK